MSESAPHVRLSKAEVADLTGSPQRAHQIGFLRLNGIKHYVDVHGWPVVLWCHLDPVFERVSESRAWKSRKVA